MKRIALLLAAGTLLAIAAWAQYHPGPMQCHDEWICTPYNGCRWVTVCN